MIRRIILTMLVGLLASPIMWSCTNNDFAGANAKKDDGKGKDAKGDDGADDGEDGPGADGVDGVDASDGADDGTGDDGVAGIDGGEDDGELDSDGDADGGGIDGDGDAGGDDGELGEDGDETRKCKLDGDFVDLDFPKKIEDCHAEGKIWNFDDNECATISEASFDCDWAGLEENASASLLGPGVEQDEAKLVGCGEADDGDTIVWQYFLKPETETDEIDCSWAGSLTIWTHCFTSNADLVQEQQGLDIKEQVGLCLNR